MNIYEKLPGVLLPWYEANKRDLPWRQDRDPYHIHLSEIMLQQTRVEAVKGYYGRFLQALPTVETLAQADDEQLHKLWEGLGYYNRVRNLKKAAQEVVERYKGIYPQTYEELLSLPGVGPYTAGAICSIAFDGKTAAVDGNVLRIITRLTEDHTAIDQPTFQKEIKNRLEGIYPSQAGAFTQALMELGATVCVPNGKPHCEKCPCKAFCGSFSHATTENFPVKSPKKSRREESLTVFILRCEDAYALEKRADQGLLAGLWQFPNVSGTLSPEEGIASVEKLGLQVKGISRMTDKEHIFTHVHWKMRGLYLDVRELTDRFIWLTEEQIETQAALPTAFRQFWEDRL